MILLTIVFASAVSLPCRDIDAHDPVWQAINSQYGRIAEAQQTKNIDALAAIYAPDMQVRGPNGESLNLQQSLEHSRNAFRLTKEEIHLSNTIVRLQLCGERATATVLQQWSRVQVAFGKSRRFDTAAVQDETWIRTGSGWKRWRIENVRPGAWYADDKRVDTTRPYDPDAPPHDPYDPHPKRPLAEVLSQTIAAKGIEAAIVGYQQLGGSPDYYNSERSMNALGYELLNANKAGEAIEIFNLNVGAYPNSANVYDSLAEAYAKAGDRRLAISNYRKSLALNPQNANAAENLKRLGE